MPRRLRTEGPAEQQFDEETVRLENGGLHSKSCTKKDVVNMENVAAESLTQSDKWTSASVTYKCKAPRAAGQDGGDDGGVVEAKGDGDDNAELGMSAGVVAAIGG